MSSLNKQQPADISNDYIENFDCIKCSLFISLMNKIHNSSQINMDKFRAITLFVTTAKTESFTATAKQHATDPSTVSKAIKRLESQLGIQLFNRSTRQLKLTSAGIKYAQTVAEY